VAFQAPFEIAQSELRRLRISSVEAREAVAGIFPFFDQGGTTRFLLIDTLSGRGAGPEEGLWVVEEFPLEIRLRKAIYPRPITRYCPLIDLEPESLAGLFHFDANGALAAQPSLHEELAAALRAGNVAARSRERERVRELFFTRDLRRLTGGVARSGLFLRRRLELAALRSFLAGSLPVAGGEVKASPLV